MSLVDVMMWVVIASACVSAVCAWLSYRKLCRWIDSWRLDMLERMREQEADR